jgi:hypothetical protein
VTELCSKGSDKTLVELVGTLLKDETYEVRICILRRLPMLASLSAEVIKSTLLPGIKEVAKATHWRLREAVLEGLPSMSVVLGQNFFEDNLLVCTCYSSSWSLSYLHPIVLSFFLFYFFMFTELILKCLS